MPAATVEEAFAYCEARAKAHYENFPVGLFVPREKRPYVYALYAFARAADDFADEPIYEGVRQEKLDQWEALTDAAYRGEARGADLRRPRRDGAPARHPEGAAPRPPLRLPPGHREDPLRELGRAPRLLPALGQPRGPARPPRLRAEGPRPARALRRDLHGLQLANHWQDAAVDYARGRIYVPEDLMRRHGVWHLGLQHRPGERRLARADGRADRPHARPLRERPPAVRPGGPRAAVRDAAHLARRDVDPRPHRGDRGRRLPAAAEARAARQGRARLARLAVAARP